MIAVTICLMRIWKAMTRRPPEGGYEWNDIGEFFLDNDQPGDDITADLAQMADKGLRSKTNEEKAKFLRINGPTMSPVYKRQKVQTSYGVS